MEETHRSHLEIKLYYRVESSFFFYINIKHYPKEAGDKRNLLRKPSENIVLTQVFFWILELYSKCLFREYIKRLKIIKTKQGVVDSGRFNLCLGMSIFWPALIDY